MLHSIEQAQCGPCQIHLGSLTYRQLIGHCMLHSIERAQCDPCQLILGEYDLPSVDWTLYAAQYRTGSV